MTKDTLRLFEKNPELGKIMSVGGKPLTHLNTDVVMATLRFSVSLDKAAFIPVGSVNCLARPDGISYRYYEYFTLDHVRSDNIDALLKYAEKHWQDAIYWNRDDAGELIDSLARFFWGQTLATPYARGSESIAKWMLTLTTRYHGQELVFSTDFAFRMPFIMSPEEFVDYFQRNVFLKSELANLLD